MRKTTVRNSENELRQFVKYELKELNDKMGSISDKFDEFKNRVYELLDKVMGELKTIREEQEIITGKNSEYRETLENHDTRIGKLENTLKSA